jgi:O-antigen/teichoic acid export membrane protein
MPQLVQYFGSRQYGLWVLISTFLGYFGLLDLGFSKALVRYISRALGQRNRGECDGWITLSLVFFVISQVVGFLLLGLLVLCIPSFVEDSPDLVIKSVLIGGGSFLIAFPSRCAIGILQAHIRGDVLDSINATYSIALILSLLTALRFESSFVGFIVILSTANILKSIILFVAAYLIHGEFRVNWSWITGNRVREFFAYSSTAFVAQFADMMRFQAFPVIISMFMGMAAVTPYAIANRIRVILAQIHNKVLVNFTPVFSQIEGRYGIGNELRDNYLFSYKLSLYFVFFTGGLTAIVATPFIERWMGAEHLLSAKLLIISLLGSLAARAQTTSICLMFGTSRHKRYSVINTVEAILVVLVAITMVESHGLIGLVAGASCVTFFVNIFFIPKYAASIVDIPLWRLHWNHTLPAILRVGLFLVGIHFLSLLWLSPTYFNIFLFSGVVAVLFVPYTLLIGFSPAERKHLFESFAVSQKVSSLFKKWSR